MQKRQGGERTPRYVTELLVPAGALVIATLCNMFVPPVGWLASPGPSLFAVGGAVSGVVCAMILRRYPWWVAPMVAGVSAFTGPFLRYLPGNFATLASAILAGAALSAMAAVATNLIPGRWDRVLALLVLTFVVAWACLQADIIPGPAEPRPAEYERMLASPPEGGWLFDGWLYMRVYALVEHGIPYYRAFSVAEHKDGRYNEASLSSAFNFREPLVFYVWKWLPFSQPSNLLTWYFVFGAAAALFGYLLAARFVSHAFAVVAGVLITSRYLEIGLIPQPWFTFVEMWALLPVLVSLWALVTRRFLLSAVMLVIAVAMRELLVILLPIWFAAWFLSPDRRDQYPAAAVCLIGPIAAIGTHLALVSPWVEKAAQPQGFSTWFNGGLIALRNALILGRSMDEAYAGFGIPFIIVGLALFGTFNIADRWRRVGVFGVLVMYMAFLLIFRRDDWGFYWGMIPIPLFMALSPLFMIRLAASSREASDRRDRSGRVTAKPRVRVVIPTHNDADTLGALIERLAAVLTSEKLDYAVAVVDGGSTDATAEVAKRVGSRASVRYVSQKGAGGMGPLVLSGLKAASRASDPGDAVITVDATAPESVEALPQMIEAWRNGADVVVASRYRRGSTRAGRSHPQRFRSRLMDHLASVLVHVEGVRDYSGMMRLYDAEALSRASDTFGEGLTNVRDGASEIQILGLMGPTCRFAEVPIVSTVGAVTPSGWRGMRWGSFRRVVFRTWRDWLVPESA